MKRVSRLQSQVGNERQLGRKSYMFGPIAKRLRSQLRDHSESSTVALTWEFFNVPRCEFISGIRVTSDNCVCGCVCVERIFQDPTGGPLIARNTQCYVVLAVHVPLMHLLDWMPKETSIYSYTSCNVSFLKKNL